MPNDKVTYDVVHEPDQNRFTVDVDGDTAVIEYNKLTDKVVFTHTGVPPQLEGRGIGSKLVRASLDWARSAGLRVIPACPFVASYIRRHSEYSDLT